MTTFECVQMPFARRMCAFDFAKKDDDTKAVKLRQDLVASLK